MLILAGNSPLLWRALPRYLPAAGGGSDGIQLNQVTVGKCCDSMVSCSLFDLFFFNFSASIPSLSHLCRLEIRSILTSERLRSDRFIRELPLPACLQDYLLYLDVLRVYAIPEVEDYLAQREEGAPSPSHSSAEDGERMSVTPVLGDGAARD